MTFNLTESDFQGLQIIFNTLLNMWQISEEDPEIVIGQKSFTFRIKH